MRAINPLTLLPLALLALIALVQAIEAFLDDAAGLSDRLTRIAGVHETARKIHRELGETPPTPSSVSWA